MEKHSVSIIYEMEKHSVSTIYEIVRKRPRYLYVTHKGKLYPYLQNQYIDRKTPQITMHLLQLHLALVFVIIVNGILFLSTNLSVLF